MSGKPFLRRVGLVLDSDARGKFMSDFERALAASGEKGAAKMRRALKEQLDLTLAELNKKFREGSIGQDDYLKRKFEAEQAFVQSLSRGMDQLRAKGELTDGEFVKLARDLAKVGDQAERTAQQFEKMGHGGKSAAEATAAAMKHAMDLRIAGLQESHRRGDLTEEGFLRRKHEAETGYVNSMLHNLAQLRAQGRLTDAEFIRMAADIDRVGREANGTALQLQKMGQHGTQASRSIGLSIGQWFTGGGVFELGRRGIDMLLGTLETLGRKVVSVLMDAPKQALEADAVWDHLRSTVENLGIAYAGVAGNIDQAVQALYARAPIFDDDEIAAGLDKLLAGTRNYTWSVNNMGLVLDVAAREQMELGEAADFVTKVYNGQTRVLKGHNVVVREGETAMDALRRTTKGYAEREAQTFMGQLKAIQNDLGNLVEDLGRVEIAGADGATALGQASSAIADLSTGLRQNRAEVVHWIRVLVAGLSTAANFVVYQVRFILNMVTAYFRAVEIVYQGGMGAIDLFAENAISKLNVVIRAMNLLPGAVKIPEIPNTWGDAAERRVRRIAVLQRALQADFADMTRAAGNVGNSLRDFWKVLNEPLALPSVNASIDAVPHGSRTDPEGNGKKKSSKDALLDELNQYRQLLQYRSLTAAEMARVRAIEVQLNAILASRNLSAADELKIREKLALIDREIVPVQERLRLAQEESARLAALHDKIRAGTLDTEVQLALRVSEAADGMSVMARAAASVDRSLQRAGDRAERLKDARQEIIDVLGSDNLGNPALLDSLLNNDALRSQFLQAVQVWRDGHAQMEDISQSVAAGIMDSWGEAVGLLLTGATTVGGAVSTMFKGMASSLAGELKNVASLNAKKDIAQAFQSFALASRLAADGNLYGAHEARKAGTGFILSAAKWVLLGGAAAGVGAAVSGGAGGGGGGGRAGAGFGAASGQQDDDENNTSGGNTRTLPPEALGMLSAAARFPEGPFQWPMGTATPYPSPVGVVVPNFVVHVTTNVDPFNPDSPTHVNQIVRAAGNAVELHGDDVFTSARKSG